MQGTATKERKTLGHLTSKRCDKAFHTTEQPLRAVLGKKGKGGGGETATLAEWNEA